MGIPDYLICLLRNLYAGQEATVVYIYLAMKNDEVMPSAEIWVDLEIIILSDVSQTEKENFMILLICGILKEKKEMNLNTKQK